MPQEGWHGLIGSGLVERDVRGISRQNFRDARHAMVAGRLRATMRQWDAVAVSAAAAQEEFVWR